MFALYISFYHFSSRKKAFSLCSLYLQSSPTFKYNFILSYLILSLQHIEKVSKTMCVNLLATAVQTWGKREEAAC